MSNSNIWIIGTGLMGIEYAKVLKDLGKSYEAIGRSQKSADNFEKMNCGKVFTGGLDKFLEGKPELPEFCIVAVGVEMLAKSAIELLKYGVSNILLEKPGVGNPNEIKELLLLAEKKKANVLLAYNRRFYASVMAVEKLIEEDGGLLSFHFEFTEWSHTIKDLVKHKDEHNFWFLGNSTHVIDAAFYLGGYPSSISAYFTGSLDWHPNSSIFVGSGKSEKGALFSYHANWEGPGRWTIEFITRKNRFFLKPIETLQRQKLGTINIEQIEIEDALDKHFKPGLYLQTKAFLENDYTRFCTLKSQSHFIEYYYKKMSGYI
jgi:predicted dehydrogenase